MSELESSQTRIPHSADTVAANVQLTGFAKSQTVDDLLTPAEISVLVSSYNGAWSEINARLLARHNAQFGFVSVLIPASATLAGFILASDFFQTHENGLLVASIASFIISSICFAFATWVMQNDVGIGALAHFGSQIEARLQDKLPQRETQLPFWFTRPSPISIAHMERRVSHFAFEGVIGLCAIPALSVLARGHLVAFFVAVGTSVLCKVIFTYFMHDIRPEEWEALRKRRTICGIIAAVIPVALCVLISYSGSNQPIVEFDVWSIVVSAMAAFFVSWSVFMLTYSWYVRKAMRSNSGEWSLKI